MPITNSEVASLVALLSRWEAAEYAAEAFVIVGCVGEFLAEFSRIRTKEWRHQLGKVSLLLLISALALELGALVRTNVLSGQEIARLYGTAADAIARAANAEEKAKGFDSRIVEAQRGTAEARRDAESAKERASEADERASANEQEASRLSKLAADEQLARARLESEIQPRTMTLEQQQYMANACRPFSGHAVSVFSHSGDAEGARLAIQFVGALLKASVRAQNRASALILVNGAPAEGVFISGLDLELAKAISRSLTAAHIQSVIKPPRPGEKEMTITVGVKPFAVLK